MEFSPIFDRVTGPLGLIRDFGAITVYAYLGLSSADFATSRQAEFEAGMAQEIATVTNIKDRMANKGLQPSGNNHPSGRSLDN